jgi:hypothetical protein
MKERIPMSEKDLKRLRILTEVKEGKTKQSKAAKILGITPRQVRRLLCALRAKGPKGLVSKKLGLRSNNQLHQKKIDEILSFLKHEDHYDFGPTLTQEYLAESGVTGIGISSVRNVMIKHGLWHPKAIRELKVHPLRLPRSRMGELIQLDGSEHDWFEGRGPRCTLLVFIDDATSKTMHLKFVKSENTLDYFESTREYIIKHGRPEAFYPDKHGVFRVNHEGALSGDGRTQFSRAMEELDIILICANSPQAKGRVERRNRDFQNRLIKAMRIAKICDIEAANAFAPSFLDKFNQKFAKEPRDPRNAHRPLLPTQNLDRIFCLKYKRQLSKNLTLQYDNVTYQVFAHKREYTLRKAEVTILEMRDGSVSIEHRGKPLSATPFHKIQARTPECSGKELMAELAERAAANADKGSKRYKPVRSHPWKQSRNGRLKRAPTFV